MCVVTPEERIRWAWYAAILTALREGYPAVARALDAAHMAGQPAAPGEAQ